MAIPNNYIDKITKDGDSRPICPPAEHVRVENDNFEGESLDDVLDEISESIGDVLDEISESIGEAGKGSVNAVKVGSTPYTPDDEGVVDLSTPFGGKVDKVNGKGLSTNDYTDADKAAVGTIGSKANSADVYDKQTVDQMVADAGGESVVINSDGVNVVDSHSNPSILVAPSARQMMMACNNINTLFAKVNDLFDKLAGIAFTNGRPANWKVDANWLTPSIPIHTITLGEISNITVYDEDNNVVTTSKEVIEGEVTLRLTPAQGTMIFAENIVIRVGNDNVPFKTSIDNGSMLVTFIISGDATFSASAMSGIGISLVGSNVYANVDGVPLVGDNRAIILSHPEHYSWDGSIGLSVNNVPLVLNTDYTLDDNQDGTKTITIIKEFTSSANPIVITANAEENGYVTIDLDNVGSGVAVKVGSSSLVDGQKLYNSEGAITVFIEADNDKKFTSAPTATIGGTAVTVSGSSVYGRYSFVIPTTSASGASVAITATATNRASYNITVPDDAHIDTSGSDATAYEGRDAVIVLAGMGGYEISNIVVQMGSDTLVEGTDYTSVTTNGVVMITIPNPSGAIVVTAQAYTENRVYAGVQYGKMNSSVNNYYYVDNARGYAVSPIFDLTQFPTNGNGKVNIKFRANGDPDAVSSANNLSNVLVLFDTNMHYTGHYGQGNSIERELSGDSGIDPTNYKYVRLQFPSSRLSASTDSVYCALWIGGSLVFSTKPSNGSTSADIVGYGDADDFLRSMYIPDEKKQNSRGDYLYWAIVDPDNSFSPTSPVYSATKAGKGSLVTTREGSSPTVQEIPALDWGVGRFVDYNGGELEISVGDYVDNYSAYNNAPYVELWNSSSDIRTSYVIVPANATTTDRGRKFTPSAERGFNKVRFIFPVAAYNDPDCHVFIKEGGVTIWENPQTNSNNE